MSVLCMVATVPARAQEEQQQRVTIEVEEIAAFSAGDPVTMRIQKDERERRAPPTRAASSYVVFSNASTPRKITARLSEGYGDDGLTIRAQMEAPEGAVSEGWKTLGTATPVTLVRSVRKHYGEKLLLSYEARVDGATEPGSYPGTITFTYTKQ